MVTISYEVKDMSSHPTQSKTIRAQLLFAMQEGEYAHCDRLPRESVLAEKMGISRTQLRDILASLEREGFITRRHGVGTIINRHVLNVPVRMDIEIEFLDMIRQSGYTPAIAFSNASDGLATKKEAELLQIEEGTPVLRFTRLCTADGRPAIYCEDVVEKSRIREGYSEEDLNQSIFAFLQEYADLYSYLDLTDIKPVVTDEALADIFQTVPGTPLLNMSEVDFDIEGQRIFCSNEYFADGFFHHTVMRKKL